MRVCSSRRMAPGIHVTCLHPWRPPNRPWETGGALPVNNKMKKAKPANDIDGYIARFAEDVQAILNKVRATIRKAAPEAREVISYQMPAFKQHGILVYFAAWKQHLGLYPPISGDAAIEQAVARYAGPKGNLQFPLDEPIPYALIGRIVRLRVKQDLAKAAAKMQRR